MFWNRLKQWAATPFTRRHAVFLSPASPQAARNILLLEAVRQIGGRADAIITIRQTDYPAICGVDADRVCSWSKIWVHCRREAGVVQKGLFSVQLGCFDFQVDTPAPSRIEFTLWRRKVTECEPGMRDELVKQGFEPAADGLKWVLRSPKPEDAAANASPQT